MEIGVSLAAIVGGLLGLVWSAERFIDGAVGVSRHLGLSPLLIGILVLGFGTSAPELSVSVLAAGQGNAGLALGNAYGSNITNIGLILGLVALLASLTVRSRVIRVELPLLGGVTLLAAWQLRDGFIDRFEALLLLAILLGFITIVIRHGRRSATASALPEPNGESLPAAGMLTLPRAVMLTLFGLVVLLASSQVLVWGAVDIAERLGVSDLVIGLTIVAVGTSMPELAASLSALRRREHDLVIGNVVGSNLFNTLAVVGVAGLVAPLEAEPELLRRDWVVMALMTLLMALFALGRRDKRGRINRLEGCILVLLFVAYIVYLVSTARA